MTATNRKTPPKARKVADRLVKAAHQVRLLRFRYGGNLPAPVICLPWVSA